MNKLLKKHLKEALQHMDRPVNDIHMRQTCEAVKWEWTKKHKDRIRFWDLFKVQIRFLGWRVWLVQNLFLITIYILFESMSDHFWVANNRYTSIFLCCISISLLLSAVPFIYRSVKYKTQEIEMASYFSRAKFILVNLLMLGIGNVIVLGVVFGLAVVKTSLSMGGILLYLGVPYLTTGCELLHLLGHTPAGQFSKKTIKSITALGFVLVLINQFYDFFSIQSFSGSWFIVCSGLVIYMIYQVRYIAFQSPYVDTY